jgi:N-acyl-D-aspartate/D-glutamate deacylase
VLTGSFPRVLGKYSRDEELITLEDAVHKMTGIPAHTFGLAPDRGVLAVGAAADIVVFRPETVGDAATFEGQPADHDRAAADIIGSAAPGLRPSQQPQRRGAAREAHYV